MKPTRWIVGCVVAANALTCAAANSVTLAQAVEAAWQRTHAAVGPQGLMQRAEAEQRAAAALLPASPSLALSTRSDRWQGDNGTREHEIGVTLPLWLPGRRDARQGAARAAFGMAERSVTAERLRLAGQVRELAWSLAGLQAEAAAADEQRRYLQRLTDDVERRVKAGDLARSDALAARGELLRADAAALELQQRLQSERLRWATLTGLAETVDLQRDEADDTGMATDTDAHPTLRLAAQATEAARRQVEVARAERSDAPELSLSIRRERAEWGRAYDGSVAIGLRVPFGSDGRNLPLQAVALATLDNARTDEARLRLQLEAEVAIAREALRSAARQLDAEQTRVRLLRERAGLIDASFRAGESALPVLLAAANEAALAEAALARQHAALGSARARLHQAMGLLP